MALDAGIFANALKAPPTVQDYDAANQQFQQNKLAIAASTQQQADQNALRQATMQFGNDPTQNRALLAGTGNYQAVQSYDKSLVDNAHVRAQTLESQSTVPKNLAAAGEQEALGALHQTQQKIDATNFHLQQLQGITDINQIPGWVADGVKSGVQDFSSSQQGLQQFLQAAQTKGLDAAKAQAMQGGQSVADSLKQQQALQIANQQNATSLANNQATNQTHLQATGMTNATSRANNQSNLAKDYTLAGYNPDGTPGPDGGGLLSPEAKANAAARYNTDGTLPPNLGRGSQGPKQTSDILNEAATQAAAAGNGPAAQRIQQLANHSNAQALNTITKQQAVVGAAEKNFEANASMVSNLAAQVDNTGVPILNKWINAGKRSVAGDPNISALDANIKATVNEYAKIVGGGTGGGATAQAEVSKIEGLLSAAQSPAQIQAVLGVMRKETANRMASFDAQKNEITGAMGGAKPTQGASPAPGALPSSNAQGWVLHQDAQGNKAYVSPDGKQFQQVGQ